MTFKKKNLPLTALHILEPFLSKNSELYRLVEPGESLLLIQDTDIYSPFFFEIQSYSIENNKLLLSIVHSPQDRDRPGRHKAIVHAETLKSRFHEWSTFLEEYEKLKSFDDPILKQYQAEFEQEIEMIDEDADYNSYNLRTQLWLDQYLTDYLRHLQSFKNDANEKEVELLIHDLEVLKSEQTKLTKRKVIKALSKIWAKTRKLAIGLLKDVYTTAKDELIKRLISGRIDDLLQ